MMELFANIRAFIKVVEDTSEQNGGKPISRLWLKAGPGMRFGKGTAAYLEALLKGTAARGAEIYISHGSSAESCRCCGLVCGSTGGCICPACGGTVENIPLDNSFIIDKVELKDV